MGRFSTKSTTNRPVVLIAFASILTLIFFHLPCKIFDFSLATIPGQPPLPTPNSPQTYKPNKMNITIRPVEDRDLEDLVDIAILSFEYDPQWSYRFPYRKQFCEDHRKFTQLYYTEYLANTRAGDNIVMVAEAPSIEDPKINKVIAFGVWDNAPDPNRPAVKPPTTHYERKDGNPDRMKAFAKKTMGIRQEVFMGKYKGRQMSLRQMATLPAYWRNGAATKLCKWGVERAESLNLAMPLFASPLGQSLYKIFGFKELGTWHLSIEGDDAEMEIVAMVWEPPNFDG